MGLSEVFLRSFFLIFLFLFSGFFLEQKNSTSPSLSPLTQKQTGVPFRGSRLRVRRPNNYDSAAAALLGPTDPDPSVDASRLGAVRTTVADGPDKVFVGGLPCDWDADRVKRLLAPYGRLAAFNLVMDKGTGNSKGYAFCEFADGEFLVFFFFFLRGQEIVQEPENLTFFYLFSFFLPQIENNQGALPTTASPRCTAPRSGPSS